jgi:hypothetical protein
MLWWSVCNIPNSSISEYLTTDTFNFGVGKYYVVKKTYGIPDSDNACIFFFYFFVLGLA